MNVTELRDALDALIANGLDPDTTVVVATEGWYKIVEDLTTPFDMHPGEAHSWVTIELGEDADARFTPAHEGFAEDEPSESWQPPHPMDAIYATTR
jgi:hypothetical protein